MPPFTLQGTITVLMVLVALISPLASALPSLRILPLGDSITKGNGSKDQKGYRNRLREKLIGRGTSVDMVGSLKHPPTGMADNDHEGHSGKVLAQINTYWKLSIAARPNVVLVHAGTNNMDLEVDLEGSPNMLASIIDGLFQNAPDTTVLVAPVIWANNPRMQKNTDRFNPQVISIIEERQKAGKHILEVPIDINAGDLSDEKHPNDSGYEKMADAWLKAILEADKRGWLKAPTKIDAAGLPGVGLGVGGGAGGAQEEIVGKIWKKQGTVFEGFRTWDSVGTIRGSAENSSREKVILADLNGDGIADYVLADKDGKIRAWINGGKPNDWKSIGYINPDWKSVTGDMIRFADVDNDGKADLIALYEDGAAKVWKNVDNGKKFESLDSRWATGLASRDKVRFEDIDGDGYADYVVVYEGGAVKWARNTHNNGKDSSKKNWETETTIAPGPAGIPQDSTSIRDIDGDGKADYLVIYQGGAVKAFRNTLKEGGRNWDDLGTIAPGIEGVTGEMIRFADMDGDGLADFLAVADDGSIRMWKNLGITGTKGQSIRFADLTGEGRDDLISVDSRGRARAWINKGDNKWEAIGEIAPGFDEDLSDSRIEFIDVNGDKRADYLIIYGGGAVKAYLNNGNLPDPGDRRIWQDGITISPGVGEPGSKVRFADLDGDGYADFLILYEGGAVKYWQNNKNIPPRNGGRIWKEGIVVATGVGEPGSKVRFADLTGDGKADYIVQYDGGAARGYRNNGKIPIGEGRKWNDMGTIAAGVSPQGPVHYADINGDRKADYLVVFDGGAVNAYLNNHDWAPKLPDNPGQPIPVEPGTGGGGGGGGDGSGDGGNDEGGDDGGNGGGGNGDDDGDGGSDGGNNGDKDVVYIDPKIWDSKNPTAGCQPPCTLILPPWPLSSKTTISFPVITETFKETWPETTSGVTKYGTTTITVKITLPPLVTSEIGVSNVILTESTSISVPVRGSVIPSPVTLTEPTHGITYTYKPGPLPTNDVNIGPPPGIAPGVIITAGPPGPICKSGCGKPCLFGCTPGGGGGGSGGGSIGCIGGGCPGPGGNCVGPGCEKSNDDDNDDDDDDDDEDDDDDDDEDCATETNTECHQVCTTKPCATVCNTYLGCDCTTSQVTDYWVSCESSSCTTTSTEVITGCFLTATATTTGASCPLTPVDYGDDFGDDNNALGNLGSTYKATFSASVIVSSTPYPVNDGYATVDRTAYSIPDVESASKTKMRGTSAVILPSYVGTTISVTIKGISFITTSYPKATTTFGETTTTEPSETTTSYPTNTAINEAEAYCYEGDTNYVEFTKDEARQVIGSFCDSSYTLDPGNTFGQNVALEEDGYTVIVSAKWAPDQSGCGDKEPFSFSEDDWNHDLCLGGWTAGYSCPNDEEDRQSSYGGAYVLDPPENGGCLLLSLYAYDTSTMRLKALPKGAESLIPPVMNVTHMGEKKEWIANDKFDGRRMWPVAESTTHGGKPSTTGVVQTKNSS